MLIVWRDDWYISCIRTYFWWLTSSRLHPSQITLSWNYFCLLGTAGLLIRWTLGLRWHFCCQGPISNLRPVFSIQNYTGQSTLFIFVTPQNMLVWLVTASAMFSRCFRHKIGLLSSKRCFSELKNNLQTKRSTSEWPDKHHGTGVFNEANLILLWLFCLDIIWKVNLKRGENGAHKNSQ